MAFRAAGTAWSFAISGTTLNLAKPAGVISGDRLYAWFSIDGQSSTVSTVPTGWTLVGNGSTTTPDSQSFWLYEKTAGGSEPSTYSFSVSTGFAGGYAIIIALSGRSAGATVSSAAMNGSSNTVAISVIATAITATAGDDLVQFSCLDQTTDDPWTATAPVGFTLRNNSQAGDGGYSSIAIASLDNTTAGSTGTKTTVFSNATAGGSGWGTILIAVPVASGGPVTYTITPTGNITFSGGITRFTKTKVQTAFGNITFSGSSLVVHNKIYGPSGSIVFSGTALGQHIKTYLPSGILAFSGTAPQIKTNIIEPSGNVTFSGHATMVFTGNNIYIMIPGGFITFSGSAIEVKNRIFKPTGLIQFIGSAAEIKTKISLPSGNVTFSGHATVTFIPFGSGPIISTRLPMTNAGST